MRFAPSAEPLPVLVVDDDSALIRTLADILRLHGYAPQTALSGREGLAMAQDRAPALAVVDLRLPDMDGVELASRLHALSELTQVVVLTGNASVESAVAAMREQSIDYLVKPVQIDRLLQVVSMAGERWQRRLAEDKLRRSDERFRRVVDSNMMGIVFWNTDGRIYDANDAFLRMLGFSRHDVEANELDWQSLTPPEYEDLDRAKEAELVARGVVAPYEKEYIRKDGTRVPILIGAATIEGTDQGGVAFILDISDRKKAELALAGRARQQAAIAELGQRALAAEDMATLYDDAVRLVAGTLDLPLACVLERRSDGRSLVPRATVGFGREVHDGIQVPLTEATIGGTTILGREPVLLTDLPHDPRFDQSPILRVYGVRSGVSVVIPGAVQPSGVLQVFDKERREFAQDDVHFLTAIAHVLGTTADRHRSERAFRQSQRLEAVGRLASGVAHDFNNMLSAMTGYTEIVLQDTPKNDPHREDLEEILKAAGRAAGLTKQLLAFSREQVLQPRMLSLNDVVVGMEKMVARLIGPEIELTMQLDPDIDWVKADPGQIEQVVLNLCVNARDAMPNGGRLTIETGNVHFDDTRAPGEGMDEAPPGDFVMLAVTDTGTGMDAETRARIFEPFFTTKGPDKGTGLGLATVYGIVKQSAGEIFVYSEPGQGSSFKVFLPRSSDMPASAAPAAPEPAPARGSETIVIAEDEEPIRKILHRCLSRAGYQVFMAFDGEQALRMIESRGSPVHLLITDVVMPNMNGSELAKRARALRPELKVLFLSGFTAASMTAGKTLEPGDFFLQKPFGAQTLVAKTREVLDAE